MKICAVLFRLSWKFKISCLILVLTSIYIQEMKIRTLSTAFGLESGDDLYFDPGEVFTQRLYFNCDKLVKLSTAEKEQVKALYFCKYEVTGKIIYKGAYLIIVDCGIRFGIVLNNKFRFGNTGTFGSEKVGIDHLKVGDYINATGWFTFSFYQYCIFTFERDDADLPRATQSWKVGTMYRHDAESDDFFDQEIGLDNYSEYFREVDQLNSGSNTIHTVFVTEFELEDPTLLAFGAFHNMFGGGYLKSSLLTPKKERVFNCEGRIIDGVKKGKWIYYDKLGKEKTVINYDYEVDPANIQESHQKVHNCALVTGATSGIGKATAIALAKLGWKVIVHGRRAENCQRVVDEIKQQTNKEAVYFIAADLSEMKAVKQLAEQVQVAHPELNVLINNAGTFSKARKLTKEGLEMTWAVNYLSRFLLTNELLDLLKRNGPSRIVDVSGMYHSKGEIYFTDINLRQKYSLSIANNQSKLANVLFTYKLARDLEGTAVTINTLHPGAVNTGSILRSEDFSGFFKLFYRLMSVFFKSPKQGAATSVYLASSPEVEGISGQYFVDEKPKKSAQKTYDTQLQNKLWDKSWKMIKEVIQ